VRVVDATKGITIHMLSEEEAAQVGKAALVPVYRVRYKQRQFMCWAQRDNALRGATEIRFEGEQTVIEYSKKSDS
jgi:hypothetical protein